MKHTTPNKINASIWLVLGIVALVGIVAKGAYWHIPTVLVCASMCMLQGEGEEEK